MREFTLILALTWMAAAGCRSTAKDPESDSAEPPSAQASEDGTRSPNASLEDSLKGVDWSVKTLDRKRDYSGTLTIFFENDTFANERDSHFTAGFGAMWTTAPVRTLSPNNMFRSLAEDSWAFLPTVSDTSYKKFFQIGGGWEIYTPADISDPDPPEGARPYAGVFAFDLTLISKSEKSLHAYTLRLGLVGPAVQAGEIQNWMHRTTGKPEAQGWDTQLSNEPLLNLHYTYQRRIVRWTWGERGLGFDGAVNGGAGLGNYYIGANAGAQIRLGFALPENFERSGMMIGSEEVADRWSPEQRFVFYVYAQGTGTAIGRFLPVDGNTFADSRSGERDDFYANVYLGALAGYGRFQLTFTFNFIGDSVQSPNLNDDYAFVTASYTF